MILLVLNLYYGFSWEIGQVWHASCFTFIDANARDQLLTIALLAQSLPYTSSLIFPLNPQTGPNPKGLSAFIVLSHLKRLNYEINDYRVTEVPHKMRSVREICADSFVKRAKTNRGRKPCKCKTRIMN